jgi:hypothetical protein
MRKSIQQLEGSRTKSVYNAQAKKEKETYVEREVQAIEPWLERAKVQEAETCACTSQAACLCLHVLCLTL